MRGERIPDLPPYKISGSKDAPPVSLLQHQLHIRAEIDADGGLDCLHIAYFLSFVGLAKIGAHHFAFLPARRAPDLTGALSGTLFTTIQSAAIDSTSLRSSGWSPP